MRPEPFIAYEPPSEGQAIRAADPAEAWNRAERFLRACTDAEPNLPGRVTLTLNEPSPGDLVDWYKPALESARARFGQGVRESWLHAVREDFSVRSREYHVLWHLESHQAGEARAYLTENKKWPRTTYGPVSLSFSFDFRWVDPETQVVLPGQTAEVRAHPSQASSVLVLDLARRSSAYLNARFPYSAADDDFVAYVGFVASHSPVPLRPNRFRYWIPTQKPSHLGYYQRKVDERLFDNGVL